MNKTLYIVRHGQTELNKRGIVQGRGMDTDLNDEGRKQAGQFFEAYKNVKFDKIYISSLKRTRQSIQQFIDLGIPYEKLSGLDELAWGIHEGQEATEENKAAFLHLMRDWMDGNLDAKFEGGESPNEVKARQQEALNIIMSRPEEETVLICMHGRALRLILCLLTERPLTEMDNFPHQNLVLYKVYYNGEKFEIIDFNNAGHLKNI
ncbi:histidine phosphatase family protein [Mucilaginibacter sp. L3T2-6]|uniref:histidine phosphatase family protein n=1 Tax=Mucilaginibacter sp. L3T2-6 TaxID=3062491 RepID=UPI002677471B|nr:histidine phosphatase family protein [Mucilaginibacter sp. L3T2-6]MDO3643123.1 histidine phosphatase family protein [Mucilaginibacter sp. L3T2-6]MDV6215890.1 histidine phosphatase family protein [Mucilaginibacter sp. L3T2-6]